MSWTAVLALLILAMLGGERSACASIAYVQGYFSSQGSATTGSVTFTAAQSAGNFNALIIGWVDSHSQVPSSVTDSKGNSYVLAAGPTWSGTLAQSIYYAKNIVGAAAGANTVTVAFTSSVSFLDVRAAEYSGVDTSNPFDGAAGAGGTAVSLSSGSVTTTNANDLLIGGDYTSEATTAPGSGYTQRFITSYSSILEDQIVSATGSYAGTAQQSATGTWVMQMAAFKAAASGDTTAPTAPTGLTTPASSSTQINLTWTASTGSAHVTGYLIERCLSSACTFEQVATAATAAYVDTNVAASTSYNYRVRATSANGNSGYSNTITASTALADSYSCNSTGPATVCYFYDGAGRLRTVQHDDGARQAYILDPAGNRLSTVGTPPTPLTQPALLTVLPRSATSMTVSWNAPHGGNGQYTYVVYRGGQALPPVTTTSMIDTALTPQTTYSYTVSAIDSAGNPSGQTPAVSNTTYTKPTISTFTTASATATSILLSWTASNTGGPPGGLTYTVTRGSTTSCTASPCTDTGLVADAPYTYTLTATNTAADSTVASAAGRTYALPVISSFTATPASSSSMTLAWTASDTNGPPGPLTFTVSRGAVTVPGCSASPCTDTGLTGNVTYTYTLTATDSTTVDKTTATAGNTTPPGVPSVPANLYGSPGISPDGNYSVIWDASTGTAAAYYNLKEGSTTYGNSTYVINAPSTAMGFHKPLITGDIYSYQVQGCTSAGVCSAYSGTAEVFICRNGACN